MPMEVVNIFKSTLFYASHDISFHKVAFVCSDIVDEEVYDKIKQVMSNGKLRNSLKLVHLDWLDMPLYIWKNAP